MRKRKTLLLGARHQDGAWVVEDGRPARTLQTGLRAERLGKSGKVDVHVGNQFEGDTYTLSNDERLQLIAYLEGR